MEEDVALPSSLLYTAWTIIANAGGGDWMNETPEWIAAATRWRDEFHASLKEKE